MQVCHYRRSSDLVDSDIHIFMYINTLRLSTLVIYSYKKNLCNVTHHLWSQNTSNLSSHCLQVSTSRGGQFLNQLCNITVIPNKSLYPIDIQQIQTVYWSGFTIGIGDLWRNSAHRKIRKSLLWSAGFCRCPRLSNRCTCWLDNQQDGKYIIFP